MALTDLKRPKPPKSKEAEDKAPETIGPSYEERPYCLRFTLEKPELEKLGLDPKSFSGMEPIVAMIEVDPITIRDNESKTDRYNENSNKSVEFQIMKIEFGEMTAKKPSKRSVYEAQQNGRPE